MLQEFQERSWSHWLRLIVGGVFLPILFPYVVYKLYRLKSLRPDCLRDKVVLITGASSGLGEALAYKFHEAGCKVILASRRLEQLERVKRNIMSQTTTNNAPSILELDLADLKAIPAKAEEALGIHGRIDILINNGGISTRGDVLETDIQVHVKVMMVNYFGQVALTKAILPSMIDRKDGSIVAISSVQGKIGIPSRSAYSASKHATQAFYDCLLSEVSHSNVHVCVISPGYIRTNLSINALTGSGTTYGVMDETTANGMEPKEVADAVIEAVVNRRWDVILATLAPRLVIVLRVLFPWLYFIIMISRAKRLRQNSVRT
ncbi:dehydrogenase/reductase SDR family protein 7-like isoform X2 [Ornithodoros turicata]|uniref:dehydrogenase/reductase SDR family protein 7-like isoform X2 n=1 Tax=Ornithodoros turicata TaxID=34597 RepID=UPI003138E3C7